VGLNLRVVGPVIGEITRPGRFPFLKCFIMQWQFQWLLSDAIAAFWVSVLKDADSRHNKPRSMLFFGRPWPGIAVVSAAPDEAFRSEVN